MAYNFTSFKNRLADVADWLAKEYLSVRTGRATPLLLDNVMIDSYGSKQPIKHVAAINTEDARTIRVIPWDKGQMKAIEQAISDANLGVSTSPDSAGIRVIFPMLTEERRKQLMKVVSDKMEEARISLRQEREKVWSEIQAQEKDGQLSEDEKFRAKDELQKIVDEGNIKLEELADRKEKEIMS